MNSRVMSFSAHVNGVFLMTLGTVMLLPSIVDIVAGNTRDAYSFLASAAVTAGTGTLLFAAFRRPGSAVIDARTGYLITVSSWLAVSFFGSLPMVFSSLHPSLTDAMFETVSGLTTTGATAFSGLDSMPPGILLWRSLLQWIGGVGIVGMAIALLPMMRIGGMQLFKLESSDVSGKAFPKVSQLARAIGTAYVGLTLACTIGLLMTGMNLFDAINHAMAAIATGGFSTKDASVGYYNSVGIEVVLTVFMALSALPLIFYAKLLMRDRGSALRDQQISGFLKILAVAILAATGWNISQGMEPLTALRVSSFNVTSILTDTGFATSDFSQWGSFAVGLFFLLYFIGGCAGSTAGAVKVFRWQILFASAWAQLKTTLSPNRVVVLKYQDRMVDADTLGAVRNFLFAYFATFAFLSLMVMATGLDFLSSTSAIAQAMANAGPGLGPIVGPASNFGGVSDVAKWLVMAGMILGRLELTTVYVVLLPEFWRF